MGEIGKRTRGEPVKTRTYPIRRQFRDFAIEGPPGVPPSFTEARDLLWRLRGAQFDQPIEQIYLFSEAELRLQQLEWIAKKLEADQKVRPYSVMWFLESPAASSDLNLQLASLVQSFYFSALRFIEVIHLFEISLRTQFQKFQPRGVTSVRDVS